MRCKDCLIWQQRLEGNKVEQLQTIPNLTRIGFTNVKTVSELYRRLDARFRELVSIMDDECPEGRCKV